MTNNIVPFTGITKHDLTASTMLENIAAENPKNVFLIVWPEDGSMPTYHSNTCDIAVVLMRLNQFIHQYYNGDFEGDTV